MIPRIDAAALRASEPEDVAAMRIAATDVGFATVFDTYLSAERVREVLGLYRAFFRLPEAEKEKIDMARTGSNRGWGGPGSEQVNPQANPDYKQVYDAGFTLPQGDPRSALPVYAPNYGRTRPQGFRRS